MDVPGQFGKLKEYGKVAAKGFVAEMVPGIAKGALVEVLIERKIDVSRIAEAVEKDESLWELIGSSYQRALANFIKRSPVKPGWLTSAWIINSLKDDLPGHARLLSEWPKAKKWLDKQIEGMRERLGE